jgi:hypothetical protein
MPQFSAVEAQHVARIEIASEPIPLLKSVCIGFGTGGGADRYGLVF